MEDIMSSEQWIDDATPISIDRARGELKRHGCTIIASQRDTNMILVTNDYDPCEWIACTPASILGWLGY